MIKKENRLKKNKHFNYIYKHGKSVRCGEVVLVYTKLNVKPYKVGFSVSNKIGKSVVRSKVKRRMSEAFKQFINVIDRRYNYIFVAKQGSENLSSQELQDNFC